MIQKKKWTKKKSCTYYNTNDATEIIHMKPHIAYYTIDESRWKSIEHIYYFFLPVFSFAKSIYFERSNYWRRKTTTTTNKTKQTNNLTIQDIVIRIA